MRIVKNDCVGSRWMADDMLYHFVKCSPCFAHKTPTLECTVIYTRIYTNVIMRDSYVQYQRLLCRHDETTIVSNKPRNSSCLEVQSVYTIHLLVQRIIWMYNIYWVTNDNRCRFNGRLGCVFNRQHLSSRTSLLGNNTITNWSAVGENHKSVWMVILLVNCNYVLVCHNVLCFAV